MSGTCEWHVMNCNIDPDPRPYNRGSKQVKKVCASTKRKHGLAWAVDQGKEGHCWVELRSGCNCCTKNAQCVAIDCDLGCADEKVLQYVKAHRRSAVWQCGKSTAQNRRSKRQRSKRQNTDSTDGACRTDDSTGKPASDQLLSKIGRSRHSGQLRACPSGLGTSRGTAGPTCRMPAA